MMNLQYLYDWFQSYVRSYYSEDEAVMSGVVLKEKHSFRVAKYMNQLTADLKLIERQRMIAETTGLLHDLSRFYQWSTYLTFSDSDSIDHGEVAALELETADILNQFSQTERDAIVFAVRHHNKMNVPEERQEKKLFASLVRDVDKIDILRSLPPVKAGHSYTALLVEQLRLGKQLSYRDKKVLADKRLIRLSWLYDLNFDWTLIELVKNGDVARLLGALPDEAPFDEIRNNITMYIFQRIGKKADILGTS
jgi:HD superfamily phosphohydrolase YqeK